MKMAKKSTKQNQINKNKKLSKRKAKAKKNSKLNTKNKLHEKLDEFQLDEILIKKNFLKSKDEHHQLIKTIFSSILNEYSKIDTTSVFSSLLLNPNYQSSQYRLEKAISICLSFCKGEKKPDLNLIKYIFEKLEVLGFVRMEDPAEDVFISTVWFEGEQYKVSTGLWEGGIYQTQIFLDFVEAGQNNAEIVFLRDRLRAMLAASNLIITKLGLKVNEIGAEYPITEINYNELSNLDQLIDKVKLPSFSGSALLPCIDLAKFPELYKQELGESDLVVSPFFVDSDSCLLILPSAILIGIKRQVVNFIREHYSDEMLDALFLNYQAKRIHETTLLKTFEHIQIKFYKLKDIEGWWHYESLIEFDKGYFFHFIFLAESLSSLGIDWFNGFTNPEEYLSKYINDLASKAKNYVIDKQGGHKGCTILVPCGYGKGLGLSLDFKSDNQWMFEVINSHDLDTISHDADCTPHRIWRIVESRGQLTTMGVKLMNPNVFLNLYAYAKDNDYCLVPHESFQESNTDPSNILINIGSNYQAKVRQKVLKDSESLNVHHHTLGNVKVIRGFNDSLFTNNDRYNIYCPEQVDKNTLQCIYILNEFKIWIEQKVNRNYDFELQFQCFEAALSWIEKIFTVAKNADLLIPDELHAWNLSFKFPDDDIHNISDCPKSKDVLLCFSNEFINPVLYSTFETEFIDGLRLEDNFSEQSLVLALVSYICDFNHITDYSEILIQVIENYAARHIHLFVAKEYREYFIADRQEPIYIEQTDSNNIKLNLGWVCRNRNQGNLIEGKAECKQYLNDVVVSAWEIIKKKLQVLDKELLIYKLLVNMEYSGHQKERWKRTFKANLALQKDKDDLYFVVNDKIGLLNGASLSSRLVIEMAICECPLTGGKEPGILDIQELICFASLMHLLGGLSEAINYDAIEPKVVISTFGDVMFNHDFNDTVLKSYADKLNKSALSTSVEKYAEHLIEPKPVESVNNLFVDEFVKAWIDEFGFTIDDARSFIESLEDYGYKENELVYKISYPELLKIFDEKTLETMERIIQELVIYPRDSWVNIPSPFKKEDWQPWRFRRRFSLIMRPLVQFDDTHFLISPQHLRNAFIYLARSCHEAALDENHFSSKLMKKWIGGIRKTNGLAFNTRVSKKLLELGWIVREEIKLPEVLNKKLKEDFGDIDVLAWNKNLKIIAVLECKNLDFAKTTGEVARQLYDFKGQQNEKGKKDRLLKHACRLAALNANKDKLSKFTKINLDAMTIKGYVVFSNTVPMEFNDNRLYKDEIEFLTFDQLESLYDFK